MSDTLTLLLNSFFSDIHFQLPGSLSRAAFKDNPRQVTSFTDENTEQHFGGGVGLQWFPAENVELNLPLSYRGNFIKTTDWGAYLSRTIYTVEARPQGSVTFDLAGMPARLLGGVDTSFARLNGDRFKNEARTDHEASFNYSQWTVGPYLTARLSPLPNLSFTTGVRFDMAESGGQNTDSSIDEAKSFTAFVYEGGIVFNPTQDLKLYARYSSLFRYPFVDELAEILGYFPGSDQFNSGLKPERGFNAELGAAYRFGNILDINANFFFMALEDEIAFVNPRNVNLDKTRRLGTNVGLNFMPVDFLSLGVSYSFVNAIFTAGPNRNNNVPLVPVHKIYGDLMISFPSGLELGPNFEFSSDSYFGGDNANSGDMIDSWFLFGARARYAITRENREFAFIVTGKNLLNRSYAPVGFYDSFSGYALYPADGRSINVSVQYRF
jgi:iron complex outermembrane receptor protein